MVEIFEDIDNILDSDYKYNSCNTLTNTHQTTCVHISADEFFRWSFEPIVFAFQVALSVLLLVKSSIMVQGLPSTKL